jgi:hypothetical protein
VTPLQLVRAALLAWLKAEQRDVIAFLREENRALKAQWFSSDLIGPASRGSRAKLCEWRKDGCKPNVGSGRTLSVGSCG